MRSMCCFQDITHTLCQWSLSVAVSPRGRKYGSGSHGVQLERIHSSHFQWPTCFLGNFCFLGTRPKTGFNDHLYGAKCQIYHLTHNFLMGSKSKYTNIHLIFKLIPHRHLKLKTSRTALTISRFLQYTITSEGFCLQSLCWKPGVSLKFSHSFTHHIQPSDIQKNITSIFQEKE